jgi:hypothetical protein
MTIARRNPPVAPTRREQFLTSAFRRGCARRYRRPLDARPCESARSLNTNSHISRNVKATPRAMSASVRTPSTSGARARFKTWRPSIFWKSSRKRLRDDVTYKPFGVLGGRNVSNDPRHEYEQREQHHEDDDPHLSGPVTMQRDSPHPFLRAQVDLRWACGHVMTSIGQRNSTRSRDGRPFDASSVPAEQYTQTTGRSPGS